MSERDECGGWVAARDEMAAPIAAHDWAGTPLGPIEHWPSTLRAAVHLMLDAPLPACIAWGPELNTLHNRAFVDILGARASHALGKPLQVLWSDLWDEYRPFVEAVLDGRSQHLQDRPVAIGHPPDHCRRWFTFSWTPLRDEAGRVAGFLCMASETTDKVQAEAALVERRESALREREHRYRLLIESIDQGYCVMQLIFDAEDRPIDFRFIEINPMFEQQSGLRDALGRTARELVPELEASWVETYGRVALSGEPIRFEDRSVPMGRWFDVYAFRVGAPAQRQVALLFSDITARKQAELELRSSEERFRLMADAAPQIIWITDADGGAEFFNRQWSRYTGSAYTPGRSGTMAAHVHPDDFAQSEAAFDAALRSATAYVTEHRLRGADGRYRWFLVRAEPRRDLLTGRVLQWYGVSTDIHDRKLAEQALAETDRRKDEFLAMLAHELRNPLAPIATAAQLLSIAGEGGARVRHASEVISRQVGHMTRLLDELLDMSRVSRGLIRIERTVLDVESVVAAAVEQVQPQLAARAQRFTLHVRSSGLHVCGDRTRLAQVLVNLLGNASRYSHEQGAIALHVGRDEARIRFDAVDNGQGIEPEMLPRVFKLFEQGPRGPDRAHGGLGLGLALVKHLVEAHDGEVEAHSAGVGRGSRFTVWLPLSTSTRVAECPPAGLPAPAAVARSVMVVDDNRDAADSLAILLRAHGHRADVAGDATAALDQARASLPDAFVLDIGLPGIDGYELARRLRAEPQFADATLIALTGYGQPGDRARSQASGFDHHLVKPVDLSMLMSLLGSVARPHERLTRDKEGVSAIGAGRRPRGAGRPGPDQVFAE